MLQFPNFDFRVFEQVSVPVFPCFVLSENINLVCGYAFDE